MINFLTQQVLKQLLNYDPETGEFTWKQNRYEKFIGTRAGYEVPRGYRKIGVNGKQYFEHRLAFLYMTGKFPDNVVDHKNHEKGDNRWCNLREATNHENNRHRTSQKNSTSQYLGVCWDKRKKKWKANIRIEGKKKHLGTFQEEADAAQVYNFAAAKHHKEFTNFNIADCGGVRWL